MRLDKRRRIVVISKIADVFASLTTIGGKAGCAEVCLCSASPVVELFQCPSFEGEEGVVFNFPFIFNSDGTPWIEANSFLLDCLRDKSYKSRPTDLIKRYADRLVDYSMFCEKENIHWLDFSGRRLSHRPTYRYFRHLHHESGLSRAVINQRTGVVYRLYEYVSANWHDIDMSRVDTVKSSRFYVDSDRGLARAVTVEVRSQTLPLPKGKQTPVGFCMDEGEKLRPLTNVELSKLLDAISHPEWTGQERLIFMFALMTGARKQTILTLRYKHVKIFESPSIRPDGSFVLKAGPGTGIDTKFNKPQTLYVPGQLAEELVTFAKSTVAMKRRSEFIARRSMEYPHQTQWDQDDVYLFLSEQANCLYMAKSDPRYTSIKTLPAGQVTKYLRLKIDNYVAPGFPQDFSFHWLRATFAYQLYQQLVPLMNSRQVSYVDAVSIIQDRLHHEDRATTENYLKLFAMISERLAAQEVFEERLFGFSSYSDLNLRESEVE